MWLRLARLSASLLVRRVLVLARWQVLMLLWLMLRAMHHLRRCLKLLRLLPQRQPVKLLLQRLTLVRSTR